ncbi:MAG: DNA polymerase I [Dictyoglomus sp. NZ13-RE01]|nr:MAG: DNA polymerase I [Dictyoglomus sp. NZ13-RE01]
MEQKSLWELIEEKKEEKILAIDASSIIYRVYYALPSLKTKNGEMTNALYGFIRILLNAIDYFKPDYIVSAFDLPQPTFRHRIYKEYKAQRPAIGDDLKRQIPWIREFLRLVNIPIIEEPGFEADDLIATLVYQNKDKKVYIISGDLDLLQLVSENCFLIHPQKGITEFIIYDIDKVKERFGVHPSKIPLYKVLVGDNSDNIPGVPGIGPKKAIKILEKVSSKDTLKVKLKELDEGTKKAIEENWNVIERNFNLVTLQIIPKKIVLRPFDKEDLKKEEVLNFLERFEMRSLISKIFPEIKTTTQIILASPPENIYEVSLREGVFAFKFCGEKNIEGLSFSIKDREGFYLNTLDLERYKEDINKIFQDERIKKIGSYIQKDLVLFPSKIKGEVFDVSIASYLLNPERQNHSLPILIGEYFGDTKSPPQVQAGYLISLKDILEKRLIQEELDKVFFYIEIPLIPVLSSMEKTGIKVDLTYIQSLSREWEERIKKLEEEIYDMAGTRFNLNSPKQLSEVLYERLKLPAKKKGKTGYSTSQDALQELRNVHPIIDKILEYREFYKLKSTYVDSIPELINPHTKRLHSSFNPTGTSTGRLSSSEPNLQNIPIRSEEGKKIRRAFIPEDGYYFISLDYSQIELRILAHLSQEEKLISAFLENKDIHRKTASEIFNIPEDMVDDTLRSKAKAVNFGIIYGITPKGLSETTGLPVEECERFINKYFEHYPNVYKYIQESLNIAREKGYVKTLFGRKRYIPEINSANKQLRQLSERIAINSPIQGTCADIIKLSMIEIYKEIEERNLRSRIILQIHDELILECPEEEVEYVGGMAKEKMENVIKLSVPLKVDISIGKNWAELK